MGGWDPELTRFPPGLKPLADKVHETGLKFLVWLEPERVMLPSMTFKLRGLNPKANYTITDFDVPGSTAATGGELMEKGLGSTCLRHRVPPSSLMRKGINEARPSSTQYNGHYPRVPASQT